MPRIKSGEFASGVVMAALAVAIPACVCIAADASSVSLAIETSSTELIKSGTACFPVPECEAIEASFTAGGQPFEMRLVKTAHIRDQRVAVFRAEEGVPESDEIEAILTFHGSTGPACVDVGPLSRICAGVLTGYGGPSPYSTPPDAGNVTRCQTFVECRDAKADILLVAGNAVWASSYVDSLALHWAHTMGLNVAIINVVRISPYSPILIRDFIRELYETKSAEHFGDGHLGFVVLLGDAYEDNNVTPMVPEYDGYGGDSEASDHFYACVSGEDEFEDLMVGRIPVGNEMELQSYVDKVRSYSPLPDEAWAKSFLFAGGCFFALKDDYVRLFDSLAVYLPEDITDSRYYRYDYPQTYGGDNVAMQAMHNLLDDGHLFVMYCGHGDRWDWGGRFERVYTSARIPGLANADRLPIILSMACYTGWFDNTTAAYSDGRVDCFAERLLTNPGGGAVACLASTRNTGGSASTEFTSEIIRAAYVNGSTYLGELILEAKVRHLCRLGSIDFVRQFNLFGDPCLNFVLNEYPITMPDLTIRPYHVEISPEFLKDGEPITVTADVWNAAGARIDEFEVAVYDGDPSSGGELLATRTLLDFWGWEKRNVKLTLTGVEGGDFDLFIVADPAGVIDENDESNNSVSIATYVYACQAGFPLKIREDVKGQVIADLDSDGQMDILVTSGGSLAQAISHDGSTIWTRDNLGSEEWFENIEPAACDLNGDGATEVILTSRTALYVLDGATGATIWKRFTDNASVSPVIADLDHDGNFEIMLATYNFSNAKVYAFNTSGTYRWIYSLPTSFGAVTSFVCADFNQNGYLEVMMGGAGSSSNIRCFSCCDDPDEQPHSLWSMTLSEYGVTAAVGADLERDGDLEIVAASGTRLYIVDPLTGQVENTIDLPNAVSALSIADTDNDEVLEILCSSEMGYLYRIDGLVLRLELYLGGTPVGEPIAVDLDGDGTTEIIMSLREGQLRIVGPGGDDFISPVPVRHMCHSIPVAADVDFDNRIEVFAGTVDSVLFALDLGIDAGRLEWPCASASPMRSGIYAQPFTGMFTDNFVLSGRVDIVGDVIIDEGSRLTLERGTDIRMVSQDIYGGGSSAELCEIIVRGDFVSRGTGLSPVTLSGLAYPDEPGAWCGIVIENEGTATITRTFVSNAVTGLNCRTSQVYLSESRIANCVLGIKADDVSPLIDCNEICYNKYGISANGGGPVIVGNDINNNSFAGIVMSDSCRAVLDGNKISHTTEGSGLCCYSSNPEILGGSKFEYNAQNGIYLGSSSPMIDSCWVAYNGGCGIYAAFTSAPVITKTSIVANDVGIAVYNIANPVLGDATAGLGGQNDIRLNNTYAVKNQTPNVIMAQLNWWGDDGPIPSMFSGPVDYTLWLTIPPAGVGDDVCDREWLSLYPNPFMQELSLSLYISARDVPLEVSIYDVRGKLVRRILSASEPGTVRAAWDGRDSNGRRVASGTYLVAVRSPRTQVTRKVVVLR